MTEKYIGHSLEVKFKKGDKVICVDETFDEHAIPFFTDLPKKNYVYTVRDSFTQESRKVVLLEEIKSDKVIYPRLNYENLKFEFEPAFSATRFTNELPLDHPLPDTTGWYDK